MSVQLPSTALADPYDTVDFGHLLTVLKRRAFTILLFVALFAAAALAHVLLATPQFMAQGMLYLGETQDTGNSSDSGTVNLSAYATESDVETQIGLLTTGTLIERAVLESGLNTTLRPAGAPPLTYWRWQLFAKGDTGVFLPAHQGLQVVDTTLPGKFRIIIGRNGTYWLFPREDATLRGKPILTGKIGRPEKVGQYTITVRDASPSLPADAESAARKPPRITGPAPGSAFDLDVVPPDVLADSLANGALSVTAGGSPEQPTKLATLELHWHDPYQAKQFINYLMADYIAMQLQWKTEAASVTENFVTTQIADVGKKLARADAALASFQSQTGIVDPQQSAQQAATEMTQFETQRAALVLQQKALQQLHESFQSPQKGVDPYLITLADDPVLSALASSLSEAQTKLAQLSAEFMPGVHDLTVQQSQVLELRHAIADLVDNNLAQATKNIKDIDGLIASYREKLKKQPAEALKVAALTRASDQLGRFYGVLMEKAEQAQISKAATIIATRVVTPSRMPHGAASPKAKIAVIGGAVAGLFVGIIVVFLQQTLSSRYESEEQIRRMIKLPVYGAIPTLKLTGGGGNFFGPESVNSFSESFRLLKRNLAASTRQQKIIARQRAMVLLVISANEGDGKTTVAANLAKTFAEDGKRVVMLDCDFHLSRLRKLKEFSNVPGLTDWLATRGMPHLQRWPGEDFWLITAGTSAAQSTRLDEPAFSAILELLSAEYDYVILDSPPLPAVSDGLVLAEFADMILSVVSVKNTGRRSFDYHNELIEGFGRPHGLIINGAENMSYSAKDAYFDRRQGWWKRLERQLRTLGRSSA